MVDGRARLLTERIELARGAAWATDKIVVDPGPDFAKTPAETVEMLRRLHELLRARAADAARGLAQGLRRRADRPGAGRRLGGTLGAIAALAPTGDILRVHDVAALADFLRCARRSRAATWRARARSCAQDGGPDRMSAFTIAQISDLHCGSPHFVPSLLERAIAEINELEPRPGDLSGDLTADGFREEYDLAREYIDRLDCEGPDRGPGNHDSRNVGYVHFEELFGARRRAAQDGVSIVAIDSTEPDVDHGTIGRGRYG